jgi:hypothetical protein
MNKQKKCYLIIVMGIAGVVCDMHASQHSGHKKETHELLISSDNFFTDAEKKAIPAELQSVLYTKYQITKLMGEMRKQDRVAAESNCYYRTVRHLGPTIVIEPVKQSQSMEAISEYGKRIEISMPAKL